MNIFKVFPLIGLVFVLSACGTSVTEVPESSPTVDVPSIISMEKVSDEEFILHRNDSSTMNIKLLPSEGKIEVQGASDVEQYSMAVSEFRFERGLLVDHFDVECDAVACFGFSQEMWKGVNGKVYVLGEPGTEVSFSFETEYHLPYTTPESFALPKANDLAYVTEGGEPMFVPRYDFANVTVEMGEEYDGDYVVDWFDSSGNLVVECSDSTAEGIGLLALTTEVVNTCDRLIPGEIYTVRASMNGISDRWSFIAGASHKIELDVRAMQVTAMNSSDRDGNHFLVLHLENQLEHDGLLFRSAQVDVSTEGWNIETEIHLPSVEVREHVGNRSIRIIPVNGSEFQLSDVHADVVPSVQKRCIEGELVQVDLWSSWIRSDGVIVYFDDTINHRISCKG